MLVAARVLQAAAAVILTCLALLVTAGDSRPATRIPVWIDTDPAIGEPERDVDDGIALVQAFKSSELEIRGISVVFGNAPLGQGLPIARRLARDFGPTGLRVFSGAASEKDRGTETEASRALADALRKEPLTILALGPATNVATVIERHPELVARIVRIVAVAGRRPGQRFTTGTVNVRGHRDFNFELDPQAFSTILKSKAPLVLAPFELSSRIWIESADLDRLASGTKASRALAAPARAWLELWRRLFHVDGFNPFDSLAIGYVVAPSGFECDDLAAEIQTLPDDITEPGMQGTTVERKPYLLVAESFGADAGRALYCSAAPPTFKRQLLDRLLATH